MHQALSPPTHDHRAESAEFARSQNQLLAAMPADELQRWAPHLTLVDLTLGQVISEPGTEMTHAYFPLNS